MNNSLNAPVTDMDCARSRVLANFLADNKWTIGEAKKAFAVWYERLGCPREAGDIILMSDLQDFVGLIQRCRDSPPQDLAALMFINEGLDYQEMVCEKCEAVMHIPNLDFPAAMNGDVSIECKSCHQRYRRGDDVGKIPTKVIIV